MPERGHCLARIKIHLRKWIGLYLAGMVLICFLNHLVYTVTRPEYSDDETLKIMLLNVDTGDGDTDAQAEALLPRIQAADAGILALEFEQLPRITPGDAQSEMLLRVQLTGGFGDIYLCDGTGLALLKEMHACADGGTVHLEKCSLTGSGAYLAIVSNTTDMESARTALGILAENLKE